LLTLGALVNHLWPDQQTSFFAPSKPAFQFSPYLDLNLAIEAGTPLASTFFSANTKSIIQMPDEASFTGLKALTLAFASGECGKEHWDGLNAQKLAMANIPALQQAKLGYTISTGGANGTFTCDNEADMDTFIRRYQSSHLLGFDFDIESRQPPAVLESLVHQIGLAMKRYPDLRFSFTLAALGSDDANSLNDIGQQVMRAIAKEQLDNYYINLMVMNYGRAEHGNCVVHSNQCDMTASAIRAVNKLSLKYHLPLQRIEVTPMIGVNDETSNVFTLEDAQKLAQFAQSNGLGGLHFWSLNRDTPCATPTTGVSATCNSLPTTRKLAFTEAFAWLTAPKP